MRERLLSTRLFTVERTVRRRPDGGEITRDVVVHPGAAVILPILDDGRIVMIRNHRVTVDRVLWELPAGTLEPGEAPIETARRELEEETGHRAGRIEPLMTFYTSPGICTELMHAFVAYDLCKTEQRLERDERIEVHTLDADDVRRRLVAGDFVDGKTIAVLGTFFLTRFTTASPGQA